MNMCSYNLVVALFSLFCFLKKACNLLVISRVLQDQTRFHLNERAPSSLCCHLTVLFLIINCAVYFFFNLLSVHQHGKNICMFFICFIYLFILFYISTFIMHAMSYAQGCLTQVVPDGSL